MFRRDATLANISLRVSAICTGSVITPFSVSSSAILFACFCVPFNVLRGGSRYLHCTFLAFGFPLLLSIDSQALFQKRVPGLQVSKREKTFAAEWFYCFRAFGNLMKPEARVFEMTSPKKQYKIMQCCLFFHFSLKCLVCVICCIQSAFIVFVSFCLYKLCNEFEKSSFFLKIRLPGNFSRSTQRLILQNICSKKQILPWIFYYLSTAKIF